MRLLVFGLLFFRSIVVVIHSVEETATKQKKNRHPFGETAAQKGEPITTNSNNNKRKKESRHMTTDINDKIFCLFAWLKPAHETISQNYQFVYFALAAHAHQISYLTISFEPSNRKIDCQMYEGIMCVHASVHQQQQKQQQNINKSIKLKETHM